MSDAKTEFTAEDIEDPAERAKANGYVEPEPPSREERVKAVVAHLESATHHNAPIGQTMMSEIKELLGHIEAKVE